MKYFQSADQPRSNGDGGPLVRVFGMSSGVWRSLRDLQDEAQAARAVVRKLDAVVDRCLLSPQHEVTLQDVAVNVHALFPEIDLDDEQVSMLAVEALDRLHARQRVQA